MLDRILRKLVVLVPSVIGAVMLLALGLGFLAIAAFWELSSTIGSAAAAGAVGGGILAVLALAVLSIWIRLGSSPGRREPPAVSRSRTDPSQQVANSLSHWVRENPATATMIALGLGTIIGASPTTRHSLNSALETALRELNATREQA